MFGIGDTKAVVGLDVGSYSVKAVALQANKDRLTLQGYAQARIDKQDPGEVIRKVLDQLGLRPKRCITGVSGRSVIVRQIETPKLEGPALQDHIRHEADKYIPFGSEEVIIDAQALPVRAGDKANALQVMLVAVRKSFVMDHIAALKAAGLQPEVIDVDVFALANAYELLGPPAPPETEKKATALIDIGASKTNIAIVQSQRVLFTREVYLAGNEISDAIGRALNEQPEDVDRMKLQPGEGIEALVDAAMPAFEDLANEIRLSFDYVEGQFDVEVNTVVLSGGSSQLPGAAGILGNILGRPVHVFDPLAGLDLVPSKYDIHTLDANSPSLSVALGLAAHVLELKQAGLGGSQSHAWQPRSARGDGAAPVPAAAAPAPSPMPATPSPSRGTPVLPTTPTPSRGTPVLPAAPATPVPAAPALSAPPPIAAPPPMMTPPPTASIAAPPPPAAPVAIAPPPAPNPGTGSAMRSSTESILKDSNRSGLLVVLEDDDDMPPLSEDPITSKKSKGTGKTLKIEGFEDDEPNKKKGSDPDLPSLPKL